MRRKGNQGSELCATGVRPAVDTTWRRVYRRGTPTHPGGDPITDLEYDPSSPAAWDIRVGRGVQLITSIAGPDWPHCVKPYRLSVWDCERDILAQLGEDMADRVMDALVITHPDGAWLLDEYGLACAPEEDDEATAAWTRWLDQRQTA